MEAEECYGENPGGGIVKKFRISTWVALMAVLLLGCKDDSAPLGSDDKGTSSSGTEQGGNGSEEPPAKPKETCTAETPLVEGIPGSPGNPIPSKVNPNGDSELASMMRAMMSDMELIRRDAMNGVFPENIPNSHAKLRCAWPTDASMRSGAYDAMAIGYIDAFDKLASREGDARQRYSAVVTACLNCHATACPGPTVAIEKLRLDR